MMLSTRERGGMPIAGWIGTADQLSRVAVSDPEPAATEWERLTRSPRKHSAYQEDLFFRESWHDAAGVLGPDALPLLWRHALLLIKPDGVVSRKTRDTLRFVHAAGFEPVYGAPVELTRHSIREVWRHDWHAYPVDRLALATFLYTSAPALLLVLADAWGDDVVPASGRLSDLKGHADPGSRLPGQLRTELRPPNPVINFVHVADEPADVVRELGILLDRPERRRLLRQLRRPARNDLGDLLDRLDREQPRHDFDIAATLDRLVAAGVLAPAAAAELARRARTGAALSWEELCAVADPYGDAVDVWDFICLASGLLPRGRPGTTALLPDSKAAAWLR